VVRLPFGSAGLAVEAGRDAELPGAALEAPAHHQPVPGLVDEEGTGDAGEGRRADEDRDLLARGLLRVLLHEFLAMGRCTGRVLLRRRVLERALDKVRHRLLAARQVLEQKPEAQSIATCLSPMVVVSVVVWLVAWLVVWPVVWPVAWVGGRGGRPRRRLHAPVNLARIRRPTSRHITWDPRSSCPCRLSQVFER
jgi:hypothetical protein